MPNYEPRFHIVLYQPQIPHNTGSVGRTCVACGAKLWLVRPLGFRVDDYYLRRAGLDYWEQLEWEVCDDWNDLAARFVDFRPWLFTKKASRPHFEVPFEPGCVILFGDESHGLPEAILAASPEQTIRIPMRREARSLNLSNAVAITAYEVLRRIGYPE